MTISFDHNKHTFHRAMTPTPTSPGFSLFFPNPDVDSNARVPLIQSDLWEAITGEHLSPQNICQLCDNLTISTKDFSAIYYQKSTDRQGSRELQQKIEECTDIERRQIFNALYSHFDVLIYDPWANYVIQKLCEYRNPETEEKFLTFFLKDVKTVINHANGCRVLQKFIENTSKPNVDQLYLALRDQIEPMCTSPNGNHIVQRFIEMLPERVPEIIKIIEPQVDSLVEDSCGCRVVQKLFDRYDIELLRPLVDRVLVRAGKLATNQYGNYVIQNILESGPDSDVEKIFAEFKGKFFSFSMHKFASNVIEKCIIRANKKQKQDIFTDIIGSEKNYNEQRIFEMITDQFGNYVIQRIIQYGTESQQTIIYDVVCDHYDETITKQYSKHVISKLGALGYPF